MVKKIFLLFLLFFLKQFLFAQLKNTDSLVQQLLIAKEDSNKVRLYNSLGRIYLFNQTDSASFYIKQALHLSEKLSFEKGKAESKWLLAAVFFVRGEYAGALDYAYRSMHIYEELKDEEGIEGSHVLLFNIYRDQGDFSKAFEHIYIAKKIIESHEMDAHDRMQLHGNLGNIYEQDNQLDSAMVHCLKAYEAGLLIENGTTDYAAFVMEVIGNIHLKKKDFDNALLNYRKALPLFIHHKDIKEIICVNNSIAKIYNQLGNMDSALFYAIKAYDNRKSSSYIKGIQLSSELLAAIYKAKGLSDSVVKYLEISNTLKDSIYSQGKVREVQMMSFNEQLRQQELQDAKALFNRQLWLYGMLAGLMGVLVFTIILWRNNQQKIKANILLQKQKEEIQNTLTQLKSTQSQLIQSEKMASLGELTAGIAHEIQNPLNFVNNFSEVNTELIDEMKHELENGNLADAITIANNIKENEQKINHHGKRADGIVKGMLQHSRSSSGVKEPTDINALADEYIRLAYHGLRAKDKSFNATMKTDFDETIGKINIIPQDIGRVILNLITNAFYAAPLPPLASGGFSDPNYLHNPTVWVGTKKKGDKVYISVRDNGPGIPQKILDKIFQPFFTTKPTGKGTGLGLSMSYDIITKGHGGEIKVETKEGEGSEFIIILPV